jgi:TfoX/Sxy family transcriptional regulator of competence genes
MAFDQNLADRVREIIAETHSRVEEKMMFGGLGFMVEDKLCVGIKMERILVRVDPAIFESVLEEEGVAPMDHSGKSMKGFVFVDAEVLRTNSRLRYWVGLALQYNPRAAASKKKKK